MKNYKVYNGKQFEIVSRESKEGQSILHSLNHVKEWDDLYKNPSYEKTSAKEKFRIWACDTTIKEVNTHILGYLGGVQFYSIYGTIDNSVFKITSTRNIIVM